MPLYRRLGLSGNSVIDGMRADQCQQAHQTDIVHTTNKQIAFDYLRDHIEMGEDMGELRFRCRQIQRQQQPQSSSKTQFRRHFFAIIDDADSVLIDEASTPLFVTRTLENEKSADTYSDALYLASTLVADKHYQVDEKRRSVELNVAGEDHFEDRVLKLPKLWRNKRKRESLVKQALAAIYFYQPDREYVVSEDKVQIIDQSTGRLVPDRAWEQGLHQMTEVKALGGLHVMSLSLNDSHRIDRQLYGRCARQGDPGSAEAFLSMDDSMLVNFFASALLKLLGSLSRSGKSVSKILSKLIVRLPQHRHEGKQRRIRKALMEQDKRLRRALAFSGRFE